MTVYRSQMKTVADVLAAARQCSIDNEGVRVTTLLRKANLPYARLVRILKVLVSSGLLEETNRGGVNKYRISEKGLRFLSEYSRFEDFASSFGLRL